MENSQELEELKSLWTVQQNECKRKIIEEDNDALASGIWQFVGGRLLSSFSY